MTEINDLVAELADDVYVRGIDLSQPFKPMTNNELTIGQLKAITGGGLASSPLGKKELNWGEICDVGLSVRQTSNEKDGLKKGIYYLN